MKKINYENIIIYLNKLNTIQNNFRIQRWIDFPCPWIEFSNETIKEYIEEYGFPNHREILFNEIVIDVDSETKKDGEIHADLVEEQLKVFRGLDYKRYKSGGTGQHFHLFFNPEQVKDILKRVDFGTFRTVMIHYLLSEKIINPEKLKSHICLHNKILIQIENMQHRKKGIKTLISGNEEIKYNFISKRALEIIEKHIQIEKERKEKINKIILSNPNLTKFNCIKFFEGETINSHSIFETKDGLNRISFALISYYKRQNLTDEQIYKQMIEWKEKITDDMWKNSSSTGRITEKNISYNISRNKAIAGCPYRRNILQDIKCLEVCEECPLNIQEVKNE